MKRFFFPLFVFIIAVGVLGGWVYLIEEPADAFTTSLQFPAEQYPEDGDTQWGDEFEGYLDALDAYLYAIALPSSATTNDILYYNGSSYAVTTQAVFIDHDAINNFASSEHIAPSYSSIYASSETITINTADTYTLASAGWVQNEENTISYSTTTGLFTIGASGGGVYIVSMNMSFGAGNTDLIHCSLFESGVVDAACEVERKLGATGADIGSMSFMCLSTFANADTVKLMCKNDGTTDLTVNHGAMVLQRIDD